MNEIYLQHSSPSMDDLSRHRILTVFIHRFLLHFFLFIYWFLLCANFYYTFSFFLLFSFHLSLTFLFFSHGVTLWTYRSGPPLCTWMLSIAMHVGNFIYCKNNCDHGFGNWKHHVFKPQHQNKLFYNSWLILQFYLQSQVGWANLVKWVGLEGEGLI